MQFPNLWHKITLNVKINQTLPYYVLAIQVQAPWRSFRTLSSNGLKMKNYFSFTLSKSGCWASFGGLDHLGSPPNDWRALIHLNNKKKNTPIKQFTSSVFRERGACRCGRKMWRFFGQKTCVGCIAIFLSLCEVNGVPAWWLRVVWPFRACVFQFDITWVKVCKEFVISNNKQGTVVKAN